MQKVIRFKQSKVPKQENEVARLKVVQGPDVGTTWVFLAYDATLGRGEENDIVVTDLKASRLHARITHNGDDWKLIDAQSANGTLLNGHLVKESRIHSGDTISLGESIFEIVLLEAGTRILTAPPRKPSDLKEEKVALERHQQKLRAITTVGGLSSRKVKQPSGATSLNSGGKRRLIIYGVLGVLLFFAFLDDPELPVKKAKKAKKETRSLANFLPQDQDEEVNETARRFFKTGFREFRERNYLRAKRKFQTALQVDPSHFLSRLYLEKAQQEIENEVKFHLEQGRRNIKSGKVQSAKSHFEAIQRLLYRDQNNPFYKQATQELEELNKLLERSG